MNRISYRRRSCGTARMADLRVVGVATDVAAVCMAVILPPSSATPARFTKSPSHDHRPFLSPDLVGNTKLLIRAG